MLLPRVRPLWWAALLPCSFLLRADAAPTSNPKPAPAKAPGKASIATKVAAPAKATSSSKGSAPARAPLPAPARPGTAEDQYVLGPDDVLDITVSNHRNLDAPSVRVRADGRITVGAFEFVASGQTPRSLARRIEARLSQTLNNARVSVAVREARPRVARISGAVKLPNAYPVRRGARLLDLVAQAGGLSTKPSRITGRVIRQGQILPFNIARALAQPNGADNLALAPDDVVTLDAQDFARGLTVTGQVAKPGAYDLDEDLTLAGLLAEAGGPTNAASLKRAQVLRDGKPVLSDLSALAGGDVPADSPLARFRFQLGDVLVVPENTARFAVLGQVSKPGFYLLPENPADATVLKALAQTGGPSADGDLKSVTLTRIENGQTKIVPLDVAAMQEGKVPDNVILRDGDQLNVPKSAFVSVSGQVLKPGPFPYDESQTVLSLVAAAGGPAQGAGLTRAYVLRGGQQLPLDLRPALVERRVDEAVANFKLQPGDVLTIPDIRNQVQVIGQVDKPGPYDLDDDLTLPSLLAKVGTPKDTAALSRAYVLRGEQRIAFDLRPIEQGNISQSVAAFHFAPGDQLIIPKTQLVAALGAVARPGQYAFPENPADASLIGLLTQAGGPVGGAGGARLGSSVILRRTPDGGVKTIPVNLATLLKTGQEPQGLRLQPNDVLYIPTKDPSRDPLATIGPLGIIANLFK